MVEELRQWGNWAKDDYHGLGYKSPCLMLMRGNVEDSGERQKRKILSYTIDDSEAMRIDRAVTTLKHYDELLHAVLVLRYFDKKIMKEISEMSQRLDKPFGKAHGWTLLGQAEKFIEGQLFVV